VIRDGPRRRPDETAKRFVANISKMRIFQSGVLKISNAYSGPEHGLPDHALKYTAPLVHAAHTATADTREYVFFLYDYLYVHAFVVECRA